MNKWEWQNQSGLGEFKTVSRLGSLTGGKVFCFWAVEGTPLRYWWANGLKIQTILQTYKANVRMSPGGWQSSIHDDYCFGDESKCICVWSLVKLKTECLRLKQLCRSVYTSRRSDILMWVAKFIVHTLLMIPVSRLDAGHFLQTRPDPSGSWPDRIRPAGIHRNLDPTRQNFQYSCDVQQNANSTFY
jgi:hypothetical protein